jgi:iron complex transport system ATP-binding protein
MRSDDPTRLTCNNIRVSVPGRLLVDALTLTAIQGEVIAVLGQNGAGKSLLLHTLAGLRKPDCGELVLLGENIFASRRQRVAQHLALLPQLTEDIFPASVLETALIGRHPHIGRFNWESTEDYTIACAALQTMGLDDMSARDILTLSGGERRRLAIAQILTQSPDVYLLDEPTNHLDPQHQLDALRIFRAAADNGATVIASLHDVNLAVRFADRCLLLYGDGRWELGSSDEILTASRLSDLYATSMEAVSWRERELFIAADEQWGAG